MKQQRDLPQQADSEENISVKEEEGSQKYMNEKQQQFKTNKHYKLNSCLTSKIKSQNKFVKVSIQTEPNCGAQSIKKTLRQKKISILSKKQNKVNELVIFNMEKKIGAVKKPRHTLPTPQNVNSSQQAEK